jgi:hypothetical protein
VNFSSAITINLGEEYESFETVIVKIEGNILEQIDTRNVEFRINNVLIPFKYDLKRIYNDYYLWFVTPKVDNYTNYTLHIYDILTTEYGQNRYVNISEGFSVTTNVSKYYIEPGFVSTTEDYKISIWSNSDVQFSIDVDFPVKRTLDIIPGRNEFEFDIGGVDESIYRIIKFGKYNVPIFIIREGNPKPQENNSISLNPSIINTEKEAGSGDLSNLIKVINVGANKVEDLYPKYDSKIFEITPNSKIDLEPGDEVTYTVALKKEKNVSESIYIVSDKNNISREILIEVSYVNFFVQINESVNQSINQNITTSYYCQELGGRECLEVQECIGKEVESANTKKCCIGKCSLIEDTEKSNSWVGYLIILAAIGVIIFVFVKYKKVKPGKTILEKTIEKEKNNN